jgi:hypothetical protein
MSSIKCEFCNKVFKTNQTLVQHKKTAKFCLKKQNNDNDIHSDKTCNYCNKVFTRKERLLSHLKICKNKKNEDLELENRIKNYENKIEQQNEIIEIYKDFKSKGIEGSGHKKIQKIREHKKQSNSGGHQNHINKSSNHSKWEFKSFF